MALEDVNIPDDEEHEEFNSEDEEYWITYKCVLHFLYYIKPN